MNSFILDERLQRDTLPVAESALSLLRLFNDARYFWLVLIPKIPGAVEWFDLIPSHQQQLHAEAMACGKVLGTQPEITKVNLGALGNVVRQLHVHLVARSEKDPAWPGPVWGHSPAIALSEQQFTERVDILQKSSLSTLFTFNSN